MNVKNQFRQVAVVLWPPVIGGAMYLRLAPGVGGGLTAQAVKNRCPVLEKGTCSRLQFIPVCVNSLPRRLKHDRRRGGDGRGIVGARPRREGDVQRHAFAAALTGSDAHRDAAACGRTN